MSEVLYDGEKANYRQYSSTFLTSSLVVGQYYTVSFYTCTGFANQGSYYISNNLGILFSVDSVTQPGGEYVINRTPQINMTNVVSPNGWEQYSFTFKADSAYNYITIGNFYDDASTTLVDTFTSGTAPYASYVFDDFSVSLCDNPNLVNNPGFEINKGNPNTINELRLATGWSNCNSSYGATNDYGTPSLLSMSGTRPGQLPGDGGTLYPHSGKCIMSEVLYDGEKANYRQYSSTFLTSSLVPGQYYTVSFYTCTGFANQGSYYISNNLGILFSVDSVSQPGGEYVINRTPQINMTNVVSPSGWEQYSFNFMADSAYNYITIGNFYDDASTALVDTFISGTAPYASYVFDDFSVTEKCDSSSGINRFSLTHPSISFYPNPVSDYATFNLENISTNNNPLTFTLYNCLGQQVITISNIDEPKFVFNRGSLSAGLYFYQFRTKNGSNVSGKMILE